MPRKTLAAVLPLLAVLVALTAGKTVARPPEGVSGRMVLLPDLVADGLREYRRETDVGRQFEWLDKLASTRDPRVAVALGEVGLRRRP
jgi:hypothetical protein